MNPVAKKPNLGNPELSSSEFSPFSIISSEVAVLIFQQIFDKKTLDAVRLTCYQFYQLNPPDNLKLASLIRRFSASSDSSFKCLPFFSKYGAVPPNCNWHVSKESVVAFPLTPNPTKGLPHYRPNTIYELKEHHFQSEISDFDRRFDFEIECEQVKAQTCLKAEEDKEAWNVILQVKTTTNDDTNVDTNVLQLCYTYFPSDPYEDTTPGTLSFQESPIPNSRYFLVATSPYVIAISATSTFSRLYLIDVKQLKSSPEFGENSDFQSRPVIKPPIFGASAWNGNLYLAGQGGITIFSVNDLQTATITVDYSTLKLEISNQVLSLPRDLETVFSGNLSNYYAQKAARNNGTTFRIVGDLILLLNKRPQHQIDVYDKNNGSLIGSLKTQLDEKEGEVLTIAFVNHSILLLSNYGTMIQWDLS